MAQTGQGCPVRGNPGRPWLIERRRKETVTLDLHQVYHASLVWSVTGWLQSGAAPQESDGSTICLSIIVLQHSIHNPGGAGGALAGAGATAHAGQFVHHSLNEGLLDMGGVLN
jgi:hypothetical protein